MTFSVAGSPDNPLLIHVTGLVHPDGEVEREQVAHDCLGLVEAPRLRVGGTSSYLPSTAGPRAAATTDALWP